MNCTRCTKDVEIVYYEIDLFCMVCGAPNNVILCPGCTNKPSQILCTTCEEDMFNVEAKVVYVKDEEDIS